jgi:hypothetical protein
LLIIKKDYITEMEVERSPRKKMAKVIPQRVLENHLESWLCFISKKIAYGGELYNEKIIKE